MRSASATFLSTVIALVMCSSFVFAPYASARQACSAEIVGRWRSLETTKGGIGQMWELRSDGTADCSTGAVVIMAWRIENNQLILPPAMKDGADQKFTLKWLGDDTVMWETGKGVAKLQRVGNRSERENPIIGEWIEHREMDGRNVEARYLFYPSGEVLLLIPMSIQHGTYSTSGSALRFESQGLTLEFKFKLTDSLLTVSESDKGQKFSLARY